MAWQGANNPKLTHPDKAVRAAERKRLGIILEDEPGYDYRTMGNKTGRPTPLHPLEDWSSGQKQIIPETAMSQRRRDAAVAQAQQQRPGVSIRELLFPDDPQLAQLAEEEQKKKLLQKFLTMQTQQQGLY